MSKVDWSKAPEGAGFYSWDCFYKSENGKVFFVEAGRKSAWSESCMCLEELMEHPSYEPRQTQSDLNAKPVSKYHRTIKGVQVDLYDVLVAYGVTCPALAHGIKKAMLPGQRHAKTFEQDIDEAIASLQRAKELAAGTTTN